VATSQTGQVRILLRDGVDSPWRVIQAFDRFDSGPAAFLPVAFDPDGRLVVAKLRNDVARTSALFRLGSDLKPVAEPFLSLRGYDAHSNLIYDRSRQRLIGVSTVTDARAVIWFDEDMRALQEQLDQLLPGTNNLLQCQRDCLAKRFFVVEASSDRQPTLYFLFGRQESGRDALRLIGPSRPWIDAAQMATQDMHRIRARDGLELPVYVTKPQGKGPWPTVMLVHGGPYVRGHEWGWHRDDQFLASRGYLVVQPEFRGSLGYGDKLFRAGWGQWGLKMQDDVTDAARWAVAQGWADPGRIAIAGASYGGYAAMMGLVKDPDFYRAAVNWVGVTDIDLLYTVSWSDMAGSLWQRYGMPRLIGDPKKDKVQLDATSPLKRAAEITKPVLMAYGSDDRRVPLPHGVRMRDALREAGKAEVEWVAYEEEGHGFLLQSNLQDFWGRVERFLARHLKGAAPQK
jgi:dipeptidyl aminopeptidase/acylaminoacyl peptidase